MRNTAVPPEASIYASAFDRYLRARHDRDEQHAADVMTATLRVLAEARLTQEPVRAHIDRIQTGDAG